MRYAAKTDRGLVREVNEDSYGIVSDLPGIPGCFIIADGMGGHNCGEVASRMAVDVVYSLIKGEQERFSHEAQVLDSIVYAMKKANSYIYNISMQEKSLAGMGTTLIVAVVLNGKLFIGHIGDSRVYLIRDDGIERITVDHSYIEEMVRNGSITREEAENHPQKNIITRALGCFQEIEVDTYSCAIRDEDYILLCTDGLTNMLGEDEIKSIVVRSKEPAQACEELVAKANRMGGEDNVTVILFRNQ